MRPIVGKIRVDYSGQRFGHRVVLRPVGRTGGGTVYEVLCDCGKLSQCTPAQLKSAVRRACRSCACHLRRHGKSSTVEYQLWLNAKERAKRDGVPFDIDFIDIVVPMRCPLLDIPLFVGSRQEHDNSPSIDKIIPSRGYVKGNIRVISHRANSIKRDASLEEMETLVNNWKALCGLV